MLHQQEQRRISLTLPALVQRMRRRHERIVLHNGSWCGVALTRYDGHLHSATVHTLLY